MLVLTRKAEESLLIDGSIEVRVLAVEGNRVRLGVNAPRDVLILRNELRDPRRQALDESADSRSPIARRQHSLGLLNGARRKLAVGGM